MIAVHRQVVSRFEPGDPLSGYYSDLTGFARRNRRSLPDLQNSVTIAQIGLGAWQSTEDTTWRVAVVRDAVRLLRGRMDADGRLAYESAMRHTYRLTPPWYSAMAQGETASLLVRAAVTLEDEELTVAASSVVAHLLDLHSPLVTTTSDGPVLQEYPTDPPVHVLNGWIFALWGVYDVACVAGPSSSRAADAFRAGAAALAARLDRYDLGNGWSRYDLSPCTPVNVASPFYHHLHIQQLVAMSRLVHDPVFSLTAENWQRAQRNPFTVASAVVRKLQFRRHRPRWRYL